jgi:hypothetical protein
VAACGVSWDDEPRTEVCRDSLAIRAVQRELETMEPCDRCYVEPVAGGFERNGRALVDARQPASVEDLVLARVVASSEVLSSGNATR